MISRSTEFELLEGPRSISDREGRDDLPLLLDWDWYSRSWLFSSWSWRLRWFTLMDCDALSMVEYEFMMSRSTESSVVDLAVLLELWEGLRLILVREGRDGLPLLLD